MTRRRIDMKRLLQTRPESGRGRARFATRLAILAVVMTAVSLAAAGGAAGESRHDLNPDPAKTGDPLGPAGRIVGVAVDPTNPKRAYAMADSGGVFGSTDGGQTWRGNVNPDG